MSPHVVPYDTGYPATWQDGPGMFYTEEYIRTNIQKLKEEPFSTFAVEVSDPLEKEPTPRDPVVRGNFLKRRRKPIPRNIRKTCKRQKCGKTFMANKKETLCSDECRDLWAKEYRQEWKKRQRQKLKTTAGRLAPSHTQLGLTLIGIT